MRRASIDRPRAGSGGLDASAAMDVDPRFALLVADLATRLRPVCQGWDEDDFQALLRQIARLKVHWGDAYRPAAHDLGMDQRHGEGR